MECPWPWTCPPWKGPIVGVKGNGRVDGEKEGPASVGGLKGKASERGLLLLPAWWRELARGVCVWVLELLEAMENDLVHWEEAFFLGSWATRS